MSAITLDYRLPDEAFRDRFSLFYEFIADVPTFEDDERADFAQVRFLIKGEGIYTFADGHTGPTHSSVKGPIHLFGVGVLPAGWAQLVDIDASLLVNRVIDAVEMFGDAATEAYAAICAAESLDHRVRIGHRLAEGLAKRDAAASTEFTKLVDGWLGSCPSPDIEDLVRASGVTRRQVERNCKRYYGAPPKVLARKYRALRAAIALAKGESSADALLAEGFYDQSHLIREVKAFTGVTPKKFTEDLPTLAQLVMKRTEIEGLNPLITQT
ncbi:HTH araC/xylS-type domain-containing protein [Sphingomonas antarctica]|uniref:AraC family transcriptional regulator n=1 Tax=Sphingomonas antarctica TaxID=2040274 RepID=UPI0039EA8F97